MPKTIVIESDTSDLQHSHQLFTCSKCGNHGFMYQVCTGSTRLIDPLSSSPQEWAIERWFVVCCPVCKQSNVYNILEWTGTANSYFDKEGNEREDVEIVAKCIYPSADSRTLLQDSEREISEASASVDDVAQHFSHTITEFMGKLRAFTDAFSLSELATLCADLGIDYERVSGNSDKEAKAREIILYLQRRQKIPDLIDYCKKHRAGYDWQ
jgi:hypothetical protein